MVLGVVMGLVLVLVKMSIVAWLREVIEVSWAGYCSVEEEGPSLQMYVLNH